MINIIFRSTILFIVLILMLRLMGKRQIGEMQPFELVITLIIADVATIPMSDMTVPLLHGIIPLFTLVILHYFITLLTTRSNFFSKLISGKPVIVVNENGIDYKAMKALNMTIDDIYEAIRGKGFFSLEEVQYAIVETTGVVNVMPKAEKSPATKEDLLKKKDITNSNLPYLIISEGKFMQENMNMLKIKEEDVIKNLKNAGIKNYKTVLIYSLDCAGNVYLQQYDKKYKVIQANKEVQS